MRAEEEVVLAFSGGLDTSYCVRSLVEEGYRVVTLYVDTGGVSQEERDYIEARAMELGATEHVVECGAQSLWDQMVVPFVWGGELYQNQYPLLCSDRYVIVRKAAELCKKRGAHLLAHGCTGMGNDQVRFDVTARALGDIEIVAPIRELQDEYALVREYEEQYLSERGFSVRPRTSRYSINENLLGVTMSGSEIDRFEPPGPRTHQLTAPPCDWPREARQLRVGFKKGIATRLDGEESSGPRLLAELNRRLGACGVGRGIYTGDTAIGLKGRIVFEAPGLLGLLTAHRALEEAVLSEAQNQFKPVVAKKWVELVYRGFYHEPLREDLEALLNRSQEYVTGEVTLEAVGGSCHAVAVESDHILRAKGAVYAQSASWSSAAAEGFIELLGQSTVLSSRINSPWQRGLET